MHDRPKTDLYPLAIMHLFLPKALLLAPLSIFFLTACSPAEAPNAPQPNVLTQAVNRSSTADSSYTGEIRARHEFDAAFRVGGKIVTRLVDAGAEIKAGQALARLDPVDLELNASSARAQLAAAESEFATVRAERERYAGLVKQKFVSSAAFEAKDNAYNSARARLTQAQAQAKISSNQAAYGVLSSDKSAVVIAVLADAGQVVNAGQAVMRLARPEEKEVAIAVPEGKLSTLKSGSHVAVNLWTEPKNIIQGRVREIAPAADAATRTFLVRIQLIDPPASVQLGMTARVVFGEAPNTTLIVPLNAVTDRGQGAQVWVVEDGKAVPRKVQVAQFSEHGALIDNGLKEGERVIISGLNRLTPGMAVSAKTAAPPERQR